MRVFSKECLEALRQRVDLSEVLSSHLDLKRSGASYKGLCPFHDEKTPSFMIQKGDSHYHCFGCGAHGDAIQFLMNYLKLSFSDAVEHLAERFQVPIEFAESEEETGPSKSDMKEALEQACRFYQFMLLHTPEGHQALNYLRQRKIDLEFIKQFQLGFSPKHSGMLRKTLHAKFVRDEIMEASGLILKAKDGNWKDFFHERIMFPIRDATGSVIGFSGRKFHEGTFGGKYVNTAETPLFKKSRVLFGLNYSRRRIAKEKKALIVEGQIDALRLIQAGFAFTVAGQGTAFGEGHARELLNLGVNEVFLALDADNAGLEATYKIGNLFQKEGVEVKVVQLPQGLDPDAFLCKQGAEHFLDLMNNSLGYLEFLVDFKAKSFNMQSPAGKNQLVQELAWQIRDWNHPVMVEESLRKLAHLAKVNEDLVGVRSDHSPNLYIKKSLNAGVETVNPDLIMETDFLRWLLLKTDTDAVFMEMARRNLNLEDLRIPACRSLYQVLQQTDERDLLKIAAEIKGGQTLLHDLLQKKVNPDKALEQFKASMLKILERNWMEKREELRMKIQSGLCSDEEVLQLVKQFDQLKSSPPALQEPFPL